MNNKKAIISGMFWTFSERMAAQIVSVVVAIVLARLLTPTEYGTVSLVTIFIAIANVFVTNGFGTALIQKEKADELDFSTVFYFGIIFSLGMYMALFVLSEPIASFYGMPILVPILRVLSIKVPISAINSVQQAYVSRHMIFKRFFWATLFGTLVSAVVGIAMAYCGFGAWSLVGQELTNTIIDTIVLWFTVKWRPILAFSFNRLKSLFGYGWKLLVQALLNTLYGNLRSLVIGKVYTSEDLAFYTKGSRYPNLIVTNVDTAMGKVLFPAMSKEQQDFSRIKSVARRSTKLCSFIMSPLLMGFAACGDTFVKLILTDKWMPMVPYLRIICVVLLVRAAQTSTLQAIKATGKSELVLKMDIPVRVLGFITLIISARLGVIYFALSEVIVEYFSFFLYGFVASKTINYKLYELLFDIGVNIVPAILMCVVVFLIGKIMNTGLLFLMIIQIVIGIVVYLLLCLLFRNENLQYLGSGLKKFINK